MLDIGLDQAWILIGFGIHNNRDNKSKELRDRGVHLFFIPICFKTQNIANYSQWAARQVSWDGSYK